MKTTVGIDPDTEKHGVAIYVDGKLADLRKYNLVEIIENIITPDLLNAANETVFSIENVCANDFVYSRNMTKNSKVNMSIARNIGACQQAQTELMRMLDHFGIKYVLHKPQSGNWAKDKNKFQRVTGWERASNEDTRSAAYFGYLAA
ncbi:MAG: hypothetical protein GW836_00705 [Paraglaciecola sp.]|nr:hypothetical protein [Paraglaciecola sp.]